MEEPMTTKAPMTVEDIQFTAWAALDRMAEIHLGDRLAIQKGLGLIQTTEFLKCETQAEVARLTAKVAALEAVADSLAGSVEAYIVHIRTYHGGSNEWKRVLPLLEERVAALQRLQEGKE